MIMIVFKLFHVEQFLIFNKNGFKKKNFLEDFDLWL